MSLLITAAQLRVRINGLGQAIDKHYEGKPLVVLVLLNGAFVFAADLLRRLDRSIHLEFVRAESYEGTHSSGRVLFGQMPEWRKYLSSAGEMPHLLVVEDIIDSGFTMNALLPELNLVGFQSVEVCTLLHKNVATGLHPVLHPRWVGFEIDPSAFVVGYGRDHNGHYRNVPYIARV